MTPPDALRGPSGPERRDARIDPLGAREVRVYTMATGDREQVRAAVRGVLAQLAGVSSDQVTLTHGPKGKPYCHTDPSLRFSVSHADSASVVAVTRVADVGVDIEVVRDVPRARAIARRFFPPEQMARLVHAESTPEAFARAWTAAEATVKVRGASIWEAGTPDPSVTVRVLTVPEGYAATVAVAHEEWELVQRPLDPAVLSLV